MIGNPVDGLYWLPMKTTNWKDIAEVIGIAAIVASLIFVGLQMRQSHEIALVTLYQMRADAAREVTAIGLENDLLVEAYERLDTGDGELNYRELYAVESYMQLTFNHFENSHFLYLRGFLPEEHWKSDLLSLSEWLRDPTAREQWEKEKHRFRPSYVAAIDAALVRAD